MKLSRKVEACCRLAWRLFWRAFLDWKSKEKMEIGQGVFLSIPKGTSAPDDLIQLISLSPGDVQGNRLAVRDAGRLLQSMKSAIDLKQIVSIRVGDVSWTTDARPQSSGVPTVIIKFDGPGGFTRTFVKQDDALAAVSAFGKRFAFA